MLANRDDLANTLVPADQGGLGFERPVAKLGVKVGVANARASELDEALAWGEIGGLRDGEVLLDFDSRAWGGDDGCGLDGGDLERHLATKAERRLE